jgi:ubiquinone/menaquinone biosynthesis C-methylase UbiE
MIQDWHERFLEQARWTESLRAYLFKQHPLQKNQRILEVGSGTGAVTSSVGRFTTATLYGLDLDSRRAAFSKNSGQPAFFLAGDALRLPFASETFDMVYCHYLLLWLKSPETALAEMARVTRSGGLVAALAEPDYSARMDYPPPLDDLGRLQTEALRRQGADPAVGRRLATLFAKSSLRIMESGIYGSQWSLPSNAAADENEWKMLESDLEGRLPPERMDDFRRIDREAGENGSRVRFVPTFYCLALRP